MDGLRIIAIDWSGDAGAAAKKKIWLAEARDGRLVRLECGRTRFEIVSHLGEVAQHDARLIVGLDFAFSLPAWYLRETGCGSAPALWARMASGEAEDILTRCEAPFWGRTGKRRPPTAGEALRRTDFDACPGGMPAKSPFQVGGSGAVGTGSLRGMAALHGLRHAGFAVWPFDDGRLPLAVEIYPRAFYGPRLKKSRRDEREEHLASFGARLTPELRDLAGSTDDAFDAAVSALAMSDHADDVCALPPVDDDDVRLEGIIWRPGWETMLAEAASPPGRREPR